MTIRYIPFESKTGFKSPFFEVTRTGEIIASSLNLTSGLDVQSLKISGIDIINNDDSTLSLGDSILNSSLTRVGTLEYLNIAGDFAVTQGSSWVLSTVEGKITITSGPETGTMDNIAIGSTTPASATFTDVTASDVTASDATVTGTITVTGTATFDDISINNIPTDVSHATRKDYVDNRISAFSIAFGA